ncbi:hypothetical protein BDR22DRAFT_406426 [Usnea florida]
MGGMESGNAGSLMTPDIRVQLQIREPRQISGLLNMRASAYCEIRIRCSRFKLVDRIDETVGAVSSFEACAAHRCYQRSSSSEHWPISPHRTTTLWRRTGAVAGHSMVDCRILYFLRRCNVSYHPRFHRPQLATANEAGKPQRTKDCGGKTQACKTFPNGASRPVVMRSMLPSREPLLTDVTFCVGASGKNKFGKGICPTSESSPTWRAYDLRNTPVIDM